MQDVVYEFDSQGKELDRYRELVDFQSEKIKRLTKANRDLSNEIAEGKKIARKSSVKPKAKKTKRAF